MQAASALATPGVAVSPGDAPSAPDAGGGGFGLTLATLMALAGASGNLAGETPAAAHANASASHHAVHPSTVPATTATNEASDQAAASAVTATGDDGAPAEASAPSVATPVAPGAKGKQESAAHKASNPTARAAFAGTADAAAAVGDIGVTSPSSAPAAAGPSVSPPANAGPSSVTVAATANEGAPIVPALLDAGPATLSAPPIDLSGETGPDAQAPASAPNGASAPPGGSSASSAKAANKTPPDNSSTAPDAQPAVVLAPSSASAAQAPPAPAATTPLAIAQAVEFSLAPPALAALDPATTSGDDQETPDTPAATLAAVASSSAPIAIDPSLLAFVRRPPASTSASPTPAATTQTIPAVAGADLKAPAATADGTTADTPSNAASQPSGAPAPTSPSADGSAPQASAQAASAQSPVVVPASGERTTIRPTTRTGGSGQDRINASTTTAPPPTGASSTTGQAKALTLGGAAQAADAATAGDRGAGDGGAQPAQTDTPQSLASAAQPGAPAATSQIVPGSATLPATAAPGAEIVAQLAAQVARKAEAGSSRFDFALDPQGLGRVDVSLKIDSTGQLSAQFSFDNPAAAADAKGRAGELQQALQQAGFDVSQSNLSFTSGGQDQGPAWHDAPAQTYARATAPPDPALPDLAAISPAVRATSTAGGLDITI